MITVANLLQALDIHVEREHKELPVRFQITNDPDEVVGVEFGNCAVQIFEDGSEALVIQGEVISAFDEDTNE
jgi:hypothetical protein